MTTPFGGSLPDEITLTRDEARDVLFALDDAIAAAPPEPLRARLERAARLVVEKLMPDLPDL
jgi:hypothetical protein